MEYKRLVGENVINPGLFYLDGLLDHKAEFKLLALDKLGSIAADAIDWSAPRVISRRLISPSTTAMRYSR